MDEAADSIEVMSRSSKMPQTAVTMTSAPRWTAARLGPKMEPIPEPMRLFHYTFAVRMQLIPFRLWEWLRFIDNQVPD